MVALSSGEATESRKRVGMRPAASLDSNQFDMYHVVMPRLRARGLLTEWEGAASAPLMATLEQGGCPKPAGIIFRGRFGFWWVGGFTGGTAIYCQ